MEQVWLPWATTRPREEMGVALSGGQSLAALVATKGKG